MCLDAQGGINAKRQHFVVGEMCCREHSVRFWNKENPHKTRKKDKEAGVVCVVVWVWCLLFRIFCFLCFDLQGRKTKFTNTKTLVGWTVTCVSFDLPECEKSL